MDRRGKSWLATGDRGSFVGNFRSFLERLGEAPEYNEGKLLDKFQAWEIPEARVQILSNTLTQKRKEAENLQWGQAGVSRTGVTHEMKQLKTELLKGTLYKNLMEVEAWETEADELMDEFIKKKLEKGIQDLDECLCVKFKEIEAMQRQKEELQSQLQEKNRQMIFKLKETNRVVSDKIEDLDRRYREQKVVPIFQTDRVQPTRHNVFLRLRRPTAENIPETILNKNDSESGSESEQNLRVVGSKRSTEAEQGNDGIQTEKNQEKQQVVSKRLKKDGQNYLEM